MLRLHRMAHQIIHIVVQILTTIILDDYVMHDHTCIQDVPKELLNSKPCRTLCHM
jgi:hypothetical protein